jgi:hypothetical protein
MQRFRDRLPYWANPITFGWFLVIIGVILRLRQYLFNRSLWADEGSLAFNLANRSFFGLTQPLDYEQGAPLGFLFIEKVFIILFGNRDLVMRLFPLLAGLLGIYFFYRIAKDHIKGGLLATFLFAVSSSLVYFSSELKQYSSDVMIAVLLAYLAGRCLKEGAQTRDFLLLGIGGAMAIWTSHPSVFILAGIGLALFIAAITKNPRVPAVWLVGLGGLWLLSFGVEYFVSLRYLIADDYLQGFWQKAFMPLPPWEDREWFVRTYYSVLLTSFNRTDLSLIRGIPLLVVIGALSLLYRERNIAILFLSPFALALLASALQKYPFKDRFVLFLVPFLFLLIAEGLGLIYQTIARWQPWVGRGVYALLVVGLFFQPTLLTLDNFSRPYNGSDIRPVIEYVAEKRSSDEVIYVFHITASTYHYYAPLYGIDGENVVTGVNSRQKKVALNNFFDDVAKLQGNDRVWFIFSGIVDCGGCEGDMQLFYTDYLDERGIMLDSFHATGANAYLYDLNP